MGIFSRGKTFRFLLAQMLRFSLFMVGMMTVGTGTAADVSSCADMVPIQVTAPGFIGSRGGIGSVIESADKIPRALPHLRAFVTAVTEHINSRLARDNLCIHGAGSMESMRSAERGSRSLLQFVHWEISMNSEYLVPVMPSTGGLALPSCRIFSPWIDLLVDRGNRGPVPSIRGIVYWNERQLLVDQAVLAGVRNVPPGTAMPLKPGELGQFTGEYDDTELSPPRKPAAKPIEERVPPDILWLLRRAEHSARAYRTLGSLHMAGTENQTKLVIALLDRCFASSDKARSFRYSSILDAADLISLEQYKIDVTPFRRHIPQVR